MNTPKFYHDEEVTKYAFRETYEDRVASSLLDWDSTLCGKWPVRTYHSLATSLADDAMPQVLQDLLANWKKNSDKVGTHCRTKLGSRPT